MPKLPDLSDRTMPHKQTLVPLETWTYHDPMLHSRGVLTDIGLMADALVYYDDVYIVVQHPRELRAVIDWFRASGQLKRMWSLLESGHLRLFHFAFITAGVSQNGNFSIWNIQDEQQASTQTLEQRLLSKEALAPALGFPQQRRRFRELVHPLAIEAKADAYARAVDNARQDFLNSSRAARLFQPLVDELYRTVGLASPPEVKATLSTQKDKTKVQWDFDFDKLSAANPKLKFSAASIVQGAAHANRMALTSALTGIDLYLPSPISALVHDKLVETELLADSTAACVRELELKVSFPDLRGLVNDGLLSARDILELRDRSHQFRNWLNSAGLQNQDALIAYHQEVAEATGIRKFGARTLKLLGLVTAGAVVGTVSAALGASPGLSVVAASIAVKAAEDGTELLFDLGAKRLEGWSPVMFGNFIKGRVNEMLLRGGNPGGIPGVER